MKIIQKLTFSFTFLLFLFQAAKAQSQKEKLSFEFGYGVNSYKMNDLNNYYINGWGNTANNQDWFIDKIEYGYHFQTGVKYQILDYLDIGIYGSYQYGLSTRGGQQAISTSFYTGLSVYHDGIAELKTGALGLGLSTTYFFSQTLKFQEKETILNRLHLGLELNGGIGFAKAKQSKTFKTHSPANEYNLFDSQDFQGQLGLKVIYDFIKSPLITSLGFRIGYQYFKTNNLANLNGNQMFGINVQENGASQPIELDFSGIYVGTFLIIGK